MCLFPLFYFFTTCAGLIGIYRFIRSVVGMPSPMTAAGGAMHGLRGKWNHFPSAGWIFFSRTKIYEESSSSATLFHIFLASLITLKTRLFQRAPFFFHFDILLDPDRIIRPSKMEQDNTEKTSSCLYLVSLSAGFDFRSISGEIRNSCSGGYST